MSRSATMLLVISLCAVGSSFGADMSFDVCNPALAQIKDNFQFRSAKENFYEYQSTLRKVDSSSLQKFRESVDKFNLNAPIAEEIIGLSGDQHHRESEFSQKYSEFINSVFEKSSSRQTFESRQDTVNATLANAWNTCYEIVGKTILAQNGAFVEASPAGGLDTFLVTVRTNAPLTDGKIVIREIAPSSVSCKTSNGVTVAANSEFDTRDFTMTCSKDPTKSIPFKVNTTRGLTQQVTLPSQTSKIQELTDKLLSLQGRFDSEVAALRSKLDQVASQQAAADTAMSARIDKAATQLNSGFFTSNWENYGPNGVWPAGGVYTIASKNISIACPAERTFFSGIRIVDNGFAIICGNAGPIAKP